MAKRVAKKEMKKEEKGVRNLAQIRKMFNKILTSHKGLTLVENRHGAVQVKRNGSLLFSARKDGMIITHPIYEGKGKKKERIFKVGGNRWDHLSLVPFDQVTLTMLEARVKDPKTPADYHDEIYKNRKQESGLVSKLEASKKRKEKAGKSATKARKATKAKAKGAAKARKATKKTTKKAIRKVATAVA